MAVLVVMAVLMVVFVGVVLLAVRVLVGVQGILFLFGGGRNKRRWLLP